MQYDYEETQNNNKETEKLPQSHVRKYKENDDKKQL